MRVVQITRYGDASVLEAAEAPTPEPGPNEVRVKIRAIAVNPADLKWRSGMFQAFAPVSFPHVLGYDIAGEIDKLGAEAGGFAVGDRVVALLDVMRKGGYAEYVNVTAQNVARMPANLDFATAAAFPTAGLTGVQLIEEHAKPSAGQTVLITGAAGAVGRFALFAAKRAGARVVAAVRASQTHEARAIGADDVIILGGDGAGASFDAVIDTVGGDDVARLCRRLKPGGAIFTASTTPINPEGLSAKPIAIRVHADAARLEALARSAAAGELTVPIAKRLPLEKAAEAHELVARGGAGGKVILEP